MTEPLRRIVLDTNAVLSAVSSRSPYRIILDALFEKRYELCLTTDILLEYEEKIAQKFNRETAELYTGGFLLLSNVVRVETFFDFKLIPNDEDDNKFVNCYVSASADSLVTNDRHFNALKKIGFPSVTVWTVDEFVAWLKMN
jgi:putative PIN family toxin of toxin-antitoxin system